MRITNFKDIKITENLDVKGKRITSVADPVGDQDVATKKYVADNAGGGGTSPLIEYTSLQANRALSINQFKTKIYNGSIYFAVTNGTQIEVYKMDLTTLVSVQVGSGIELEAGYSAQFAALNVDSSGNIGIVFRSQKSTNDVYNLYFAYWNGTAWTTETISEEANGSGYHATAQGNLYVDSSGNWHVAFYQKHSGSTTYVQLRYNKRTSGTWGTVENLGTAPVANYYSPYAAIVIEDGNSNTLVFVRDNSTATAYLACYKNTGTWTTYISTYNYAFYNVFAVGDEILVCCAHNSKLFNSTTNTWSDTGVNNGFGRYGSIDIGGNEALGINAKYASSTSALSFKILDTTNLTTEATNKNFTNIYGVGEGIYFYVPPTDDATNVYMITAGAYPNILAILKYR